MRASVIMGVPSSMAVTDNSEVPLGEPNRFAVFALAVEFPDLAT